MVEARQSNIPEPVRSHLDRANGLIQCVDKNLAYRRNLGTQENRGNVVPLCLLCYATAYVFVHDAAGCYDCNAHIGLVSCMADSDAPQRPHWRSITSACAQALALTMLIGIALTS